MVFLKETVKKSLGECLYKSPEKSIEIKNVERIAKEIPGEISDRPLGGILGGILRESPSKIPGGISGDEFLEVSLKKFLKDFVM